MSTPPTNSYADDAHTPLLKHVSTERRSLTQKLFDLLADWWLWEILGIATSVLALGSIVAIFVVYDGSSRPDWPSVLTVRRSSCFE